MNRTKLVVTSAATIGALVATPAAFATCEDDGDKSSNKLNQRRTIISDKSYDYSYKMYDTSGGKITAKCKAIKGVDKCDKGKVKDVDLNNKTYVRIEYDSMGKEVKYKYAIDKEGYRDRCLYKIS